MGGEGGAERLGLKGAGNWHGVPHPMPQGPRCPGPQLGEAGQEMKPGRTESETAQVEPLEGRKGALPHLDWVGGGRK